ncbi:BEN domain-containing protein 2 [Dipodomys merriami]|uniref:BEN domain-containing protein 2 n=1 Tax=Dipodomys merriami TaxID=94247 RepID=UPI003855F645
METDEPDRTTGTSFQSVSCHEQQQEQQEQQLVLSQDLFLPRIISTSSLTSEGSVIDVPIVSDILDEAESSNIVISDAQPTIAPPAPFLLPQDPSFANNHNFIKYSAIVENEGTAILDPDFPCLLVPPTYEMPENEETNIPDDTVLVNVPNFEEDEEQSTNLLNVFINEDGVPEACLENNSEPMNSSFVMGNNSDHHSSAESFPSVSGFERVILIEVPGQIEVNDQTLYYPAVLRHFNHPDSEMTPASAASSPYMPAVAEASQANNMETTDFPVVNENDQYSFSADTLSSQSDFERVILIEMPGQTDVNDQTLYYPALLGHFNGPDSEMAPASAALHSGVQGIAEASLDYNPEGMHFPPVMENDNDTLSSDSDTEDTIVIEISEDAEISGQAINYPGVFGHFSDSDSENVSNSESTNFQDLTAVGASLVISPEVMHIPPVMRNDHGQYSYSADTLVFNSGFEEVVLGMPGEIQVDGQTVYYPTFLGHKAVTYSETASASSDIEAPILVVEEDSLESNPELINFPAVVNYNDHSFSLFSPASLPPDSDIEKVILIKMPETVKVNDQIVVYPGILGRIITSDSETASASESANVGVEKIILEEIAFDPKTMDQDNSDIMDNPPELGNDSDYDNDEEDNESPFFSIPLFFDDQELIPVRVNCPVSMENGTGQDNIPEFPLITGFAYLGDPRRNIRIHNIHLETIEKMTKLSLAACYLVYVVFSEESLINSAASINGLGYPDLDPNRMAAIREHLANIFLQYDLTENGSDWSICMSSIRRLVENLCIEVQTHLHEVALVCVRRNDDGEGSNEPYGRVLYGRRVLYGTRNGKPVTCYVEQLGHLGHSSRRVQVPSSVMTIAKTKHSPELSARYLSHYLFTEELSRNTIFDNVQFDVCNLDDNTIAAIREFLQESFPSCNLMEDSDDWKVCLAAICSSIRAFKQKLKTPKAEAGLSHPSTEE